MQEDRLTTQDFASTPERDDRPEGDRRDDHRRQAQGASAGTGVDDLSVERDEPLLPSSEMEELRRRWESVQARFVDDPRTAVEEADSLVAEVMRMLADTFASERSSLEEQWDRAGEADTEALRVTLQRYRSFFHRLLST